MFADRHMNKKCKAFPKNYTEVVTETKSQQVVLKGKIEQFHVLETFVFCLLTYFISNSLLAIHIYIYIIYMYN